jgi:hypothetical protein
MLIPDIASVEKWRMFFRGDVSSALGYCERVLGLYNSMRMSVGDVRTKKIVVGVIGKDTIGHWRDIQEVFKEFFGIRCIRCEEAVKNIAMGIPYTVALQRVSLRFEAFNYIRSVEELAILLSKVLKESGVHLVRPDGLRKLDRDVSVLLNNPLNIIDVVKSFYESLRRLLPLYNRFTFFITVSRSITESLMEKYFRGLNLEALAKFNIKFRKETLCRDIPVFMHVRGSLGETIMFTVNSIYKFLNSSRGMRKFIDVVDEEERFVKEMLRLATNVYRDMGYTEDHTFYSALYRGAISTLVKGSFIRISTRVRIDREKGMATVHGYTTKCENLVNLLEPYIMTGIAHIGSVTVHNDKTELLLNIYLDRNCVKT